MVFFSELEVSQLNSCFYIRKGKRESAGLLSQA